MAADPIGVLGEGLIAIGKKPKDYRSLTQQELDFLRMWAAATDARRKQGQFYGYLINQKRIEEAYANQVRAAELQAAKRAFDEAARVKAIQDRINDRANGISDAQRLQLFAKAKGIQDRQAEREALRKYTYQQYDRSGQRRGRREQSPKPWQLYAEDAYQKALLETYGQRASLRRAGRELRGLNTPQGLRDAGYYEKLADPSLTNLTGIQSDADGTLWKSGEYLKGIRSNVGIARAFANDQQRARMEAEAARRNAPEEAWYETALSTVIDNTMIGTALEVANYGIEAAFMRPWYAAANARQQGLGLSEQLSAGGRATLGGQWLGFMTGGGNPWGMFTGEAQYANVPQRTRQIINETRNYDSRQVLADQGRLPSFGNEVRGWLTNTDPNETFEFRDLGIGTPDFLKAWVPADIGDVDVSTPFDFTINIVADPLTWTPVVGAKAANVGATAARGGLRAAGASNRTIRGLKSLRQSTRLRAVDDLARLGINASDVTQGARAAFLSETPTGRAIQQGWSDVLEKRAFGQYRNVSNPDRLARMLNIDHRLAKSVVDADSLDNKLDILREAFKRGEYEPRVTVRRQVAAGLGAKHSVSARGIPFLYGQKTLRKSRTLYDFLDNASRKSGSMLGFGLGHSGAPRVIDAAIEEAVPFTDVGVAKTDFWNAKVAPEVAGLSDEDRYIRALELAEQLDPDEAIGLRSAMEAEYQAAMTEWDKKLGQRVGKTRGSVSRQEIEDSIRRAETLVALTQEGGDAAKMVVARLNHAYSGYTGTAPLLAQARDNVGLGVRDMNPKPIKPKPVKLDPKDPQGAAKAFEERVARGLEAAELNQQGILGLAPLKAAGAAGEARLRQRFYLLPPSLRTKFIAELDRAVQEGAENYDRIARQLEAVLRNPDLLTEADRLARGEVARLQTAAQVAQGFKRPNAVRRGLGALPLSVMESYAPPTIPFRNNENWSMALQARLDNSDRWMTGLGFDEATRRNFLNEMARVRSEQDIYDLVEEAYVAYAQLAGVPEEVIVKPGRELYEAPPPRAFGVDEDGELLEGVQLITQKREDVPVLDPDEIAKLVREWHATHPQGVGDYLLKGRVGLTRVLDKPRVKSPFSGADISVREAGKKLHRFWKAAVVLNLPGPAVGAVGGFIGTDGDVRERLQGAVKFGAIGFLGGARYVARVVLIEERALRYQLARASHFHEWVPFLSKRARSHGMPRPYRGEDALGAAMFPTTHMEAKLTGLTGPDWVVMPQSHARFVDAWWRIVNYQINPVDDELARLYLQGAVGELDDWEAAAKAWLKDDGKVYWQRLSTSYKGPKTVDEALANVQRAVDHALPTNDLKLLRLSSADIPGGEVSREVLRKELKAGNAPEAVHSQEMWVIPKNMRELGRTLKTLHGRAVMELPTRKWNRLPMAEHMYADEVRRMIAYGTDPKRAQEVAEVRATNFTNKVMFNINNESRFAAKADYIFPFQQPREEMLRVYANLVVNNKARTLRMTRLAALAFNNGANSGMFYEDQYGDWRMRVPGNAWLSRIVGADIPAEFFDFRLKDALFLFQGTQFAAAQGLELTDIGGLGLSVTPVPGGPWWQMLSRTAFDTFPGLQEQLRDTWVYDRLFPYGSTGLLARPELRRLWFSATGSPAPWEFAGEFSVNNEIRKAELEVIKAMRYEYVMAGGDAEDPNWEPNRAEVHQRLKDLFLSWAVVGSITAAPTRYVVPGRSQLEEYMELYKEKYGEEEFFFKLLNDHPEFDAFLSTSSEFIGDDTFENWSTPFEESYGQFDLQQRAYFTADEFIDTFKQARKVQAAWRGYNDIWAQNFETEDERYEKLEQHALEHPEMDVNGQYTKMKHLAHIQANVPYHKRQAELDKWRRQYDVSHVEYKSLVKELTSFRLDPWKEARPKEEVERWVDGQVRKGRDLETTVRRLSGAEQVRFWKQKQSQLAYVDLKDPESIVNTHESYQRKISEVFKFHPELLDQEWEKSPVEKIVGKWRDGYYEKTAAAWERVNELDPAIDAAYANGQYALGKALRDEQSFWYDVIKSIKNEHYKAFPDIIQLQKDAMALFGLTEYDVTDEQIRNIADRYAKDGVPWLAFGEEKVYLQMNPTVQKAWVWDLIQSLEQEYVPGGDNKGKRYWEWLTDFQRDQVMKYAADEDIWKWANTKRADQPKKAYGYNRWYSSRSGWRAFDNGDLHYAYNLMKQYNRRPEGAEPPAAYDEYLNLPQNPGVRRQFLLKHPEVAEWIRLGPLANMPEIDRYIVQNAMIRHGKWEGEVKDSETITELAWARQQMEKWTKRPAGSTAPAAYDTWLNMPTGIDKAEFLKAHPEVSEWIRLGPMNNMPDHYQDVVRDIMLKYGEWTQGSDPLGEVISQFYTLPSHARQAFLEDHPELVEYWRALRTPEEQYWADLSEQYFAIVDPQGRRLFLAGHPELQSYFIEARTKRYEKFLNQVAMFMGQNPELFEHYLERQSDVLAEMLRRFATAPVLREQPLVTSGSKSRQGESGRRRAA